MPWLWKLTLMRLAARWRSLLTLIIGVLLAAVVGASAPLYTGAIAKIGLLRHIEDQSPSDRAILVRSSLTPASSTDFAADWTTYDATFDEALRAELDQPSGWLDRVVDWAESTNGFLLRDGEEIESVQARLAYYGGLADTLEIVAGRLPEDIPPGEPVEVILPEAAAEALELSVGDMIQFDQRGWDTSRIFDLELVGIVREADPAAVDWFDPSPLRFAVARSGSEANFLTTRTNLTEAAVTNLPQSSVQLGWRVFFDFERLPLDQLNSRIERLQGLEDALSRRFESLNPTSLVVINNLPDVLQEYAASASQINLPFGLLLVQLGALVLFFLVVIAALVRRGERREIAMLQSRGAYDRQIIVLRGLEALIICLLAVLLAPLVAQALLTALIPTFTTLTAPPLDLSVEAYLYAGTAALFALVVLILTLLPVLRLPLITAGGSAARSDRQTWWQRLYLDWVLLIVGLVALFQLTNSQSLAAGVTEEGITRADPLLLLAPTLLFIAFSSILLRFFPGLMTLAARTLSGQRGLTGVLAAWQVSREPLHYGRIAFLLALALGIGWFAVAFQSTLVGGQMDQAAYEAGADVRISLNNPENDQVASALETLRADERVTAAVPYTRLTLPNISLANTSAGRRGRESGVLLAIDPQQMDDVLLWNSEDFPGLPTTTGDTSGRQLPDNTQALNLWAYLDMQLPTTFFGNYTEEHYPNPPALWQMGALILRLRSTTGAEITIPMEPDLTEHGPFTEALQAEREESGFELSGSTEDFVPPDIDWPLNGWMNFSADLSELDQDQTWLLDGIIIEQSGLLAGEVRLTLADLTAEIESGDSQSLNWFAEADEAWSLGNPLTTLSRGFEPVPVPETYGSTGQRVIWSQADRDPVALIALLDYPPGPTVEIGGSEVLTEEEINGFPALLSRSFAERNELAQGQRFRLSLGTLSIWFEVVDVVDLYPTLYQSEPYLVVDQATLQDLYRRLGNTIPPNEIWLDLAEDVSSTEFAAELRADPADLPLADISRYEAIQRSYETDTLTLGVIGLLYLSFLVGLALSIVALFTYISLSVQSRLSEFAVLRALGQSSSRLIASIVLEQVFVLGTALLLGALIGQFLTLQVLPPLALSTAGGVATPPFIIRIDGLLLARYGLLIAAVLALVLTLTFIWIRRAAGSQALRLSEE